MATRFLKEKTVWLFREKLTKSGLVEDIFAFYTQHLETKGLIMNEGKMVDASFTIAPRQRNTREENQQIKEGKGADLWNDRPHKKRHKDIDARCTGRTTRLSTAIRTTRKWTQAASS